MSHGAHAVPYHGTFKGYATGFGLAVILTAIPFVLVMNGSPSRTAIMIAISLAALVQIGVHLHYFLHLDTSKAARGNVMSLMFTGLIMLIFIIGTLWIMYNLRIRMTDHGPSMATPGMTMSAPAAAKASSVRT